MCFIHASRNEKEFLVIGKIIAAGAWFITGQDIRTLPSPEASQPPQGKEINVRIDV
jgi:hypothetical protein